MHPVAVRHIEEALFEEARGAMRDHAVTLHLSESETAVSGTTFRRLSRQDLSRTSASRMNLVTHHMLEALIVGGIQEDHHLHALACEAIVHHFVTVALVAEAVELVGDELDCLALEGCRITFITIETGHLTEDSLDQVTNSHT